MLPAQHFVKLGIEVGLFAYRDKVEPQLSHCEIAFLRASKLPADFAGDRDHAELPLREFVGFKSAQNFPLRLTLRLYPQCLGSFMASGALDVSNIPIHSGTVAEILPPIFCSTSPATSRLARWQNPARCRAGSR